MEVLFKIIDSLGFYGVVFVTTTSLLLTFILVSIFGIKFAGISIPGFISLYNQSKENKKEKASQETEDDYSYSTEINGEKIGFDIPKPRVMIYGNTWNSKDEKCVKAYIKLEDRWRDSNIVDITQCNITSSLVSILADKAENFKELKIYARQEQLVLLNILNNYSGVQFEVR